MKRILISRTLQSNLYISRIIARNYTTSAVKFPEIPDSESVKAELQKFSNSGKIHRDVIIKESAIGKLIYLNMS
jgi:hypothetical protein